MGSKANTIRQTFFCRGNPGLKLCAELSSMIHMLPSSFLVVYQEAASTLIQRESGLANGERLTDRK